MEAYDYHNRQGVNFINWWEFAQLCQKLTEKIVPLKTGYDFGVARAGLLPATTIACALRCDLWPVRLTRREEDEMVRESPEWKVEVPETVKDKRVVIVDEIADTGETLAMVATQAREKGASEVITVAMAKHTWAKPAPDLVEVVSDSLIIFPWDAQVLIANKWQLHPELQRALEALEEDNEEIVPTDI